MARPSKYLETLESESGNLSPSEREMLGRLFGTPQDFPPDFKGWLRDYILQEVVPSMPGAQIKGVPDGTAPATATFVTLTSNSKLSNERTLTAGEDISVTDGGANSPVTVAVAAGLRHRKLDLIATSAAAAVTASSAHDMFALDASGGAFTVTLPAASGHQGRVYVFKKADSSANAVTIDGNAAETIDGAATVLMSQPYEMLSIVCDGSNWLIINHDIPGPLVTRRREFVETAGAGVYTATVPIPAGGVIHNVAYSVTASWDATTTLIDAGYTGNLTAFIAADDGSTAGFYNGYPLFGYNAAEVYSAAAHDVIMTITTTGAGGTTGRTFFTVTYSVPPAALTATKV